MLQLARLEESPQVDLPSLDLDTVVQSVATLLEPIANDRGLQIAVESAPGSHVRLPAQSAETLVSNLLLNAIQHSPPGGPIGCAVRRDEAGSISLVVTDAGDGIGAEALSHIFERFYREDTSRSRETGGTGLGLAICKSTVEAAGGKIQVESKRNAGTKMTVTFISA